MVSQLEMAGFACSSGLELVDENWGVDNTFLGELSQTSHAKHPRQQLGAPSRHGEGPGAIVTHTWLPGGVEIIDVRRLVDRVEMCHTTEVLRDGQSLNVTRATWRRVETRREQLVGEEAWNKMEDTRASGMILQALQGQLNQARQELEEMSRKVQSANGGDEREAAAELEALRLRLALQQKQYSQTLKLVKNKTEKYRQDTEAATRHKMLSLLAHDPEKQVEYAQLAMQRLADRKERKGEPKCAAFSLLTPPHVV